MIHVSCKRSIYSIIVALLVIQLGCSGTVGLPEPPSEQLRKHFGTIGVVSVQFVPEIEILTPAKGWTSRGARRAVHYTREMWAVLGTDTPGCVLACALTPFVALGGCIAGASKELPAAEVEKDQEEFNKHVHTSIEIQEKMRAQFIQVAREQTHYAFVVLEDQGPATPNEELSYDSLADHGIDTVIEIGVLNFGLRGHWTEINPPLSLFMTLRTRLNRIADGEVVYDATLTYESVVNQRFDVWVANEAQLFKEELGPCYPTLVKKIVEEVFLLYLPS
jgi:hypothetical protein